jgi:hypothetical protein
LVHVPTSRTSAGIAVRPGHKKSAVEFIWP